MVHPAERDRVLIRGSERYATSAGNALQMVRINPDDVSARDTARTKPDSLEMLFVVALPVLSTVRLSPFRLSPFGL